MPETIPSLSKRFLENMQDQSFQDIAFGVVRCFFGDDVPDDDLRAIVYSTINFDAPLVPLSESIHVLELFHGPTLAFKDFGARFMAQLMSYFVRDSARELVILVATSGDTGSAVASGFLNVPHIQVVILYPSGKVSPLQEKQLTTMGGNIVALEVQGVFDDCQRLVKQAFVDPELAAHLQLTSANSINIARLIPQAMYYVYAVAQLKNRERPLAISVPSGNFGNLTAGLMAKRMGLPVQKFIAATNRNDVFGEYVRTGTFTPRPSTPTISNAMDVGNPSNFARMLELYDHNVEKMREDIFHASFSDDETRIAITEVFEKYHYILDPHGAVGYLGLSAFLKDRPEYQGIFLETAHPAKFPEIVEEVIGQNVETPARLAEYMTREKHSIKMPNDFLSFKQYLMSLPVVS
jgi:threonine synthase